MNYTESRQDSEVFSGILRYKPLFYRGFKWIRGSEMIISEDEENLTDHISIF